MVNSWRESLVIFCGSGCNDTVDCGIGGCGVMVLRVMTTVIGLLIGILNFLGRSKG